MKVFFTLIFLVQSSVQAIPSLTLVLDDVRQDHQVVSELLAQNERNLLQSRSRCRDDFICPTHSSPKPNRECYDTMDDCVCDPGFIRRGNRCTARRDLCSESYATQVERLVDDVEYWMDQVERTPDFQKEDQIQYAYNMNSALENAWDSYIQGAAACELFFDDGDNDNRKLRTSQHQHRVLFGRRFRNIGRKIAQVVKTVVRVVVKVVETVVNVVEELVECGVGIIQDGPKCGLVGCAFGLVGAALDVAFTAATGGANKAASVACDSLADLAADSLEKSDDQRRKESFVFKLKGIGSTVCTINDKLGSPTLSRVCATFEAVEQLSGQTSTEIGFDLIQSDLVVFRFIEAFITAMCGSPGSAVLDLLEEVVVCEIGCAEDANVFCPATSSAGLDNSDDEEEEEEEGGEENGQDVEYRVQNGKACRTASGGRGNEGRDFIKFDDTSSDECERLCTRSSDCEGFESSNNSRCEIWETVPVRFDSVNGFSCHVKL